MNEHRSGDRGSSLDEGTLSAAQRWLEDEGASLFPAHCVVAVQRYDKSVISLPEVVDSSLDHAVEKRRREFSAGRIAACAALRKLGVSNPAAITIGPARNPQWPAGFTGSITHTAGLAVAVVARAEILTAVGIDLELANAVQPELWPSLLRATEIDFVLSKPIVDQSRWATILFSAKESFYKMQYPLTGEWVDFHDAEIEISKRIAGFELRCSLTQVTGRLHHSRFDGRFSIGPGFSLAAMHLPAGQI